MHVVGVDGCPGGWVAIAYDAGAGVLDARVHRSFADLLTAYADAGCVGVDIPIGLAEGEPRRCDVAARRVLGPRRHSVFPAPDPRLVDAPDYAAASALSRVLTGKGISKQGHAIYAKVAEVNRLVTPELQDRVVEVHPEVSFWALNGGRPMTHPKRRPDGFAERRALLAANLDALIPSRDEARRLARPAAPDDVLDAIVAAWTARRVILGEAQRLPPDPEVGTRGLRMEIVY